jgi:hypothetical protein
MAFQAQTGGDLPKSTKLSVGQHHVTIKRFKVKDEIDRTTNEPYQKILWVLESTDKFDDNGQPLMIFASTGVRYGASNAALTAFIDQIFGRKLGTAIVSKMDLEGLADGSISGEILVLPHTTQDGQPSVKFGAWVSTDYEYRPEDYFITSEVSASQEPSPNIPDTAPPRVQAPVAQAAPARPAAPARQAPARPAPPRRPAPASDDLDTSGIEDPFAE